MPAATPDPRSNNIGNNQSEGRDEFQSGNIRHDVDEGGSARGEKSHHLRQCLDRIQPLSLEETDHVHLREVSVPRIKVLR